MSGNPVAAAAPAPYLAALNDRQREAVEATEGPLLVLAGAGTGKTRVLTTRLAHIAVSGRAWPSQILAVTFTNKAAREMRDRVAELIGDAVDGLWIGTFHALAARMLRRHAEAAGLRPDFTILDADDQIRLVKSLAEDANIDSNRWPARSLHAEIQRFKDRGLGPEKVSREDAEGIADGMIGPLYTSLSGPPEDSQRLRLRRSPAALHRHLHRPRRRSSTAIRTGSVTSWSTNTRTPTSRNISG